MSFFQSEQNRIAILTERMDCHEKKGALICQRTDLVSNSNQVNQEMLKLESTKHTTKRKKYFECIENTGKCIFLLVKGSQTVRFSSLRNLKI